MAERGATKTEVSTTLSKGKRLPARLGRIKFTMSFSINLKRNGNLYKNKKVEVTAELIDTQKNHWKVITVLTKLY
jgi:hypothetical protein